MATPSQGRTWLLLGLVVLAVGASAVAHELGLVERVRFKVWGRPIRLSAGDFPAGVSAPDDDVPALPTRATVVGLIPRGSVAPLLWAAGDDARPSLFRTSYALDVKVVPFASESALRGALVKGGDNGGVDVAALTVPGLAMATTQLRDAVPRTVLLLGRSRGQDILVSRDTLSSPSALQGRRVAFEPRSAGHYLVLWALSRVGLPLSEVRFVELDATLEAGAALRDGRADAVSGLVGDVGPVAKELAGAVLAPTADAPHLLATVLVVRGDFGARYPDAIRRLLRGVLDANTQVARDANLAARALGTTMPLLGDPTEAIAAAAPASLRDNLAFFELSGEAPVTYLEAYQTAAALQAKIAGAGERPAVAAEETVDVGPLKFISAAKGL